MICSYDLIFIFLWFIIWLWFILNRFKISDGWLNDSIINWAKNQFRFDVFYPARVNLPSGASLDDILCFPDVFAWTAISQRLIDWLIDFLNLGNLNDFKFPMIYFSKCICDCVESSCASSLVKLIFHLLSSQMYIFLVRNHLKIRHVMCSTAQKKLVIKSKLWRLWSLIFDSYIQKNPEQQVSWLKVGLRFRPRVRSSQTAVIVAYMHCNFWRNLYRFVKCCTHS
jgi:hypothetical protein